MPEEGALRKLATRISLCLVVSALLVYGNRLLGLAENRCRHYFHRDSRGRRLQRQRLDSRRPYFTSVGIVPDLYCVQAAQVVEYERYCHLHLCPLCGQL